MYTKSTAYVILNGKRVNALPLREKNGQWCASSPLTFNMVGEVLVMAVKQGREIKYIRL